PRSQHTLTQPRKSSSQINSDLLIVPSNVDPLSFFFALICRPPRYTLFPYTTLFRSHAGRGCDPRNRRATEQQRPQSPRRLGDGRDRKSTRLNSSHVAISYAVFCLKKKTELAHLADHHSNLQLLRDTPVYTQTHAEVP